MTRVDNNWVLAGVDTGGTFTDFAVLDARGLRVHKVLSTPRAPENAILQGLAEMGLDPGCLRLRHGSTVATNAVLEGKGARTAYVTNRGLADVLTIGRQNRRKLYTLSPLPEESPVPAELCLETGGRLAANGAVIDALDERQLAELLAQIRHLEPEAVAINLLFSYLDDRFEQQIQAALPGELFVSRASAVLAEIGEYERGIATWLNASVGPLIGRYLARLADQMPGTHIQVMQSSGMTVDAAQAADHGVHLLLSGPAGGLAGALAVGRRVGLDRLMTLDVGGTSTDVALLDGGIQLTRNGYIAHYPVAVPMVDMHTIGAGGGSLVRVDEQGLLHVGPQSAGASPGPACYGTGGREPTLTDAHLILGRIPEGVGLGGVLKPDLALAHAAMAPVAKALGMTGAEAAAGVLRLANEHMAGALRVISLERGHDPRDFALCCFGGGGGLHACDLAELLGMRQVLVPVYAGVLSALGMLFSAPGREVTQAMIQPLESCDSKDLIRAFDILVESLVKELREGGVETDEIEVVRSVDLRYLGQSTSIAVPWVDLDTCSLAFHQSHYERYGHRLELPLELVCLRVRVLGKGGEVHLSPPDNGKDSTPDGYRLRCLIGAEELLEGPMAVVDDTGTTWIARDWHGQVDESGNLLLNRGR